MEDTFLVAEVQQLLAKAKHSELQQRLLAKRLVPAIPYICGKLIGADWDAVSSRPWAFAENITVLEARAAFSALMIDCLFMTLRVVVMYAL